MRTGDLTVPTRHPSAAWVTDPSVGERLANRWLDENRPGRRVAGVRTHSALYRGPDDVSARVGVRLDGNGATEEATLLVRDRAGAVSMWEFPDDPDLPTLAAVLRPELDEPALRDVVAAANPPTVSVDHRVTVVHHPREGACVLRLDLAGAQVYAKVYPHAEDAARAADALEAVGVREVASPGSGAVRLPRVLGVSVSLRTTFLESLTPPESVGDRPTRPATVSPEEAARALRALHAHLPVGHLPEVRAAEHVARVRREQRLVASGWPALAERVDAAVTASGSLLENGGTGWPVLCHGDFTPSQLVRVPGPREAVGLVDLDTLSLGEAASDLGRFLAYEDVRGARHGQSPSSAAATRAALLDAYGPPPGGPTSRAEFTARVWAHRRLNLALLALRAARRYKGARVELALTLLDTDDTMPGRPS